MPLQHHTDFCLSWELTSAVHLLITISSFQIRPFQVAKQHAAEHQAQCGHAHLGWAYLLAFSEEKGFLFTRQRVTVLCELTSCGNECHNNIFDIFSEIFFIVLSLKVWKAKQFINLPVCETAYSVSSFVTLSNISSWYSKKLRKVTVSKYKMTAKDIVMLPDTSHSCSA